MAEALVGAAAAIVCAWLTAEVSQLRRRVEDLERGKEAEDAESDR